MCRQSTRSARRTAPRWAELERVLRDEQEHLTEARDAEARRKNPLGVPVGLALSGGGIRSATFCLGVLQALAQRGWIRRIDYLSTVSGGGYIGSWLSACIYRARKTGTADPIGEVEKRIAPRTIRRNGEEPTEIRFLRAYSNYLTPRLGVFSGDTLAAFAGSLRNLGLNLILGLISVCVILAALHWMIAWLFAATHSRTGVSFLGALASAAIFVAFAGVAAFLTLQSYDIRKFVATAPTKMVLEAFTILQRQPRWFVSYPLALGLVAGGVGSVFTVLLWAAWRSWVLHCRYSSPWESVVSTPICSSKFLHICRPMGTPFPRASTFCS